MAWKSPTSVMEESGYPWNVWDTQNGGGDLNDAACDDDTGTYIEASSQSGWTSEYLEANYSGGLWCSKVRVYLESQGASQINIDAYYGGSWHDVYQGSTSEGAWETYWLPKIANVTAIRIKLYSSTSQDHRVNEVDFWEVEEDVPSKDNLIALYKLNDNEDNSDVDDSSGNGHNGTVVNDENNYSSEQSTTGKINGAFNFDGTNDYVSVADHADWDTGDALTVSLWFKTSYNQSAKGMICHDQSNYKYMMYITGDSGRVQFYVRQSSGVKVGDNGDQGDGYYADGLWRHLVGVFERNNEIKLYIDGARGSRHDGAADEPIVAGDEGLNIGQWGSNSRFHGRLDAVMIFDKALRENEVAWLYNRGRGKENVMIPRHAMEKY